MAYSLPILQVMSEPEASAVADIQLLETIDGPSGALVMAVNAVIQLLETMDGPSGASSVAEATPKQAIMDDGLADTTPPLKLKTVSGPLACPGWLHRFLNSPAFKQPYNPAVRKRSFWDIECTDHQQDSSIAKKAKGRGLQYYLLPRAPGTAPE